MVKLYTLITDRMEQLNINNSHIVWLQGWFKQENKIIKNQLKLAETIYTPFSTGPFFSLFWPCPATLRIYFSEENSWH